MYYILYMYCYYSYYFSVVYRHKSLFLQKIFLWPKSNILIEACYYVNTWPSVLIACQFVLFSSFQCLCLGEFRGETCAWSITPHHTMTKYLPFNPNKYQRLGFAWLRIALLGMAPLGIIWLGITWLGSTWLGIALLGIAPGTLVMWGTKCRFQ